MKKNQPLVSIITVNYNQLQVTLDMLESVFQCGYSNIEAIVVDNGSVFDASENIREQFPKVKYIRSKHNLGFAGGNNLGLRNCSGDYVFLLNNDAILPKGALERLVDFAMSRPKLGAVSPLICYFNDVGEKQDLIQYAGTTFVHPLTARNKTIGEKTLDFGQFDHPRPTAYAHGAAMLIPKTVIEKVGLMPEEFFLYYEELDWCEKMRRMGFEIMVEPRAKVYHKESLSIGQASPLKTYYLNRNRILFMRRNRKWWQFAFFCLFLCAVTIPKNAVSFLIRKDYPNLRAFFRAIKWNAVSIVTKESKITNRKISQNTPEFSTNKRLFTEPVKI